MTLLIGFLTVLLVLTSVFLILLVLIQLPKKEAGLGVAFGSAATEALFGAGSGTVLTKVTKYCAGIFMGLSLFLSVLNAHTRKVETRALDQEIDKRASAPAAAAVATNLPASSPTSLPTTSAPAIQLTSPSTVTGATMVVPPAPVTTNPPAPAPAEPEQ